MKGLVIAADEVEAVLGKIDGVDVFLLGWERVDTWSLKILDILRLPRRWLEISTEGSSYMSRYGYII